MRLPERERIIRSQLVAPELTASPVLKGTGALCRVHVTTPAVIRVVRIGQVGHGRTAAADQTIAQTTH